MQFKSVLPRTSSKHVPVGGIASILRIKSFNVMAFWMGLYPFSPGTTTVGGGAVGNEGASGPQRDCPVSDPTRPSTPTAVCGMLRPIVRPSTSDHLTHNLKNANFKSFIDYPRKAITNTFWPLTLPHSKQSVALSEETNERTEKITLAIILQASLNGKTQGHDTKFFLKVKGHLTYIGERLSNLS